jgi:hypothetical protein
MVYIYMGQYQITKIDSWIEIYYDINHLYKNINLNLFDISMRCMKVTSFLYLIRSSGWQVLTKPCLKGEKMSIKICKDEYLASVLDCQNVLHRRFTLPKGSSQFVW